MDRLRHKKVSQSESLAQSQITNRPNQLKIALSKGQMLSENSRQSKLLRHSKIEVQPLDLMSLKTQD